MPGVEWVVGNSHKTAIADLVTEGSHYHGNILVGDIRCGPRHGAASEVTSK